MPRAGNGWFDVKAKPSLVCFERAINDKLEDIQLKTIKCINTHKGSVFLFSSITSSAAGDSSSSNHVFGRSVKTPHKE